MPPERHGTTPSCAGSLTSRLPAGLLDLGGRDPADTAQQHSRRGFERRAVQRRQAGQRHLPCGRCRRHLGHRPGPSRRLGREQVAGRSWRATTSSSRPGRPGTSMGTARHGRQRGLRADRPAAAPSRSCLVAVRGDRRDHHGAVSHLLAVQSRTGVAADAVARARACVRSRRKAGLDRGCPPGPSAPGRGGRRAADRRKRRVRSAIAAFDREVRQTPGLRADVGADVDPRDQRGGTCPARSPRSPLSICGFCRLMPVRALPGVARHVRDLPLRPDHDRQRADGRRAWSSCCWPRSRAWGFSGECTAL